MTHIDVTQPNAYTALLATADEHGYTIGLETGNLIVGPADHRRIVAISASKRAGDRTLTLREPVPSDDLLRAAAALARRLT